MDKLLQVYLAFIKDGHLAYTKKNAVLKETTDIYKGYSLKVNQYLTCDNLIRLYLIYLRAERERATSDDKRTPIPYYVIGFFGHFINNKENSNNVIENIFEEKNSLFESFYRYLCKLTKQYKKNHPEQEYNTLIKKPIDKVILAKQIDDLNDILLDADPNLKNFFAEISK
ncbi:hypothetical protein GCM10023093_24880 [Nemorincola caseinilytica]|uniref:Uncharacterized protein n=1 Tax=Nemorincola caseinilytica TaxID=2054315 RepID=A0ABP8NN00_9BACT